ncbi:MAG: hypothetical protein HC896_03380 [Bacteroidales bacterium]|nr:hypothetical protein [Bacteroidales bacterium]
MLTNQNAEKLNVAKSLLKVLVIFVLLDVVFGLLYGPIFFRHKNTRFAKTNYALNQAREDVVIIGDSRAENHYNPTVFKDSTGLSFYNTGSDGQGIFYYKALLDGILNRYSPKAIVLDIYPDKLNYYATYYDRISYLSPFYFRNKEVRNAVELKGNFEKHKLMSSFYRYNSTHFIVLKSFIRPKAYLNGFHAIDHAMDPGAEPTEGGGKSVPDTLAVKYFEAFIEACKERNVKLIVVISPFYKLKVNHESAAYKTYMQLVGKYKVDLIDYGSHPDFATRAGYFADLTHLNAAGAAHFSNLMAAELKKRL